MHQGVERTRDPSLVWEQWHCVASRQMVSEISAQDCRLAQFTIVSTALAPIHTQIQHVCLLLSRSEHPCKFLKMTDTDQLTSLFASCKLEDVPDRHVLELEYPVRRLLPPHFEPSLEPPANLDRREAPPHDQCRAGVYQSVCRIYFATENRKNPNAGFDDWWYTLHSAFESLTYGPGTSKLEAVSFRDHEMDEDVIRVCLHTSLDQEAESHSYDFEFTGEQWKRMVEKKESSWVDALDELITRRSDLAYYHVRNRVACDYGQDFAVAEEALWSARWGGNRLRQLERDQTTVEDISQSMEAVGL